MIGFFVTQSWIEIASSLRLLYFLVASPPIKHCPQVQHASPWFREKKEIGNDVLWVLFRETQITAHCPIHGPSPSDFRWTGCGRYSTASPLEVLLGDDDFRFFIQALALGDVSASFTTKCDSVLVWTSTSTSMFTGIDTQPCMDSYPPTGLSVLEYWVFGFCSIRCVYLLLPPTFESNSFIQLSLKEIVDGGRSDTYTFPNMTPQIPSQQLSWSMIAFVKSFSLNKIYVDPIHRILVSFPLLLVECETWFVQINLWWIAMILMDGNKGCKEYNLSFPALILSSRYQSRICDVV